LRSSSESWRAIFPVNWSRPTGQEKISLGASSNEFAFTPDDEEDDEKKREVGRGSAGSGVLGTKSEAFLFSGARTAEIRFSDPVRLTGRALLADPCRLPC